MRFLGGVFKIIFIPVIIVGLLLITVRIADWVMYSSFYTNSTMVFLTPGLDEGYVPQGFDFDDSEDTYLLSGGMIDKRASRIYTVDEEGNTQYTELKLLDETNYSGELGGIAYYGDYIYVAGQKGVDVFSYTDVLNGEKETRHLGTVTTYVEPSYCTIYNGYLFTGSYYETGGKTADYEYHITPSGEVNPSIITVFKLDETAEFGVDSTPKAVITTTSFVQGICFTDNNEMIVSTSGGLRASKLYAYDLTEIEETEFTFEGTFNQEEFTFEGVKKYHLESKYIVETITAPPMCEEIFYRDGKIYIMNGAASNKYFFGKFTTGSYTYAYQYKTV